MLPPGSPQRPWKAQGGQFGPPLLPYARPPWVLCDRLFTIGVLASDPMSSHQALLFRQLSDDVMYFIHTMPPSHERAEQLAARGIRLINGEVASLEINDDGLTGVRLADGAVIARRALVVAPRMVAQASFLADLGLRASEHPSGLGEHIPADPTGRANRRGVWVAGNVTDPMAHVGASAAAGAFAAAQINDDLVGS